MAKIQDSDLTKCWQVCKELGHLYIDSGNIECYSCFGTHFGNLFKKKTTTLFISCLINNSQSNRCEVVSLCGI